MNVNDQADACVQTISAAKTLLSNVLLPKRRQRSKRLYIGQTRKGRQFLATTSNGANISGRVELILDLEKDLTKTARRHLALRLVYLAARLWQANQ